MKKLTKKALAELLKSNFMISNYVGIIQNNATFYVVYRDRVVLYRYEKSCDWCFSISGYSLYSDTKQLLKLVSILDENFYAGEKND